ncbi:MAG: acyl-CoA dehydrogenase family protein [Polyangiaceae bacterium]|nr:acyl-CoA dehydrogenase family protein [Polyangiaceae bacterium]
MSELDDFRAELRAWLLSHCPPSMRTPPGDGEEVWGGRRCVFPSEDARRWLLAANTRGLTAPTWPTEYGGGGMSREQAAVLAEELRALGCRPPLRSLGIWMLGPVLLRYGTEAQRRAFLPGIIRGETRWCQGYSEPGAGSDLASLSTRAVRDGDHYVVDGQKTWTSHADKADWMFCLVRTNPSAPKHQGISFVLIDMASPGITVRPIQLISGASPFCETFFEGVRVPVDQRVGDEDAGWEIGKYLLSHERSNISLSRDAQSSVEEPLAAQARRYEGGAPGEPLRDASLRDRITQVDLDFLCNKLALRRAAEEAAAGRPAGSEASMFKLVGTEVNKRRRELKVALRGFAGLGWEGEGYLDDELTTTREWLRSRANSIEGGSSEVQLNILAKRVLGLPD